jgi:hypothetical protein
LRFLLTFYLAGLEHQSYICLPSSWDYSYEPPCPVPSPPPHQDLDSLIPWRAKEEILPSGWNPTK